MPIERWNFSCPKNAELSDVGAFVAYGDYLELESQLTAEREARQKAEAEALNWHNSYGNASTASLHWRERAEALEARIKASQEQEPAFIIHDELGNTHNLYKQPLIMPEVEELVGWCPVCNTVRMSLPKPAEGSCSHCFNHLMKLASAYDLQELQRENAELARKLAEQQAMFIGK